MRKSEIDAIPLGGDTSFRERAIEPGKTALLLIDLQKGEYNDRPSMFRLKISISMLSD